MADDREGKEKGSELDVGVRRLQDLVRWTLIHVFEGNISKLCRHSDVYAEKRGLGHGVTWTVVNKMLDYRAGDVLGDSIRKFECSVALPLLPVGRSLGPDEVIAGGERNQALIWLDGSDIVAIHRGVIPWIRFKETDPLSPLEDRVRRRVSQIEEFNPGQYSLLKAAEEMNIHYLRLRKLLALGGFGLKPVEVLDLVEWMYPARADETPEQAQKRRSDRREFAAILDVPDEVTETPVSETPSQQIEEARNGTAQT